LRPVEIAAKPGEMAAGPVHGAGPKSFRDLATLRLQFAMGAGPQPAKRPLPPEPSSVEARRACIDFGRQDLI